MKYTDIIINRKVVMEVFWLDKINQMKKEKGMTTDDISNLSGIPKGTLNKLFAGQTKDPQLSTVKAVVHCMGFTLDDLDENVNPPAPAEAEAGEKDIFADELIGNYKALNREGQRKLIDYSKDLVSGGRYAALEEDVV